MKKKCRSISLVVFAMTLLCSGQTAQANDAAKWAKIQDEGTVALDSNKYWIAEPLLKQAVIVAGGFGNDDKRLAKSLGELGRLYTIRGRFDEAEPYLEEELHVKELALGKSEGQTIPDMGSLIRFYLLHGTTSKAEPLTKELLAFVEGKLDQASTARMGKMTFKKGQALEAWAGAAAPVARDPLIEWAITCDDLGNLYLQRENYDLAELLFKAALDVKSTVLGKEHLSLANSYDSLGNLCMQSGDYKEAVSYYKDALSMTEKILGPGSSSTYFRLEKLAKCHIKAGQPREAEALYKRAQEFWKDEEHLGDKCRAVFALGCLYADEKNYSAAAPLLHQALALAEKANGPDSASLVPYLQKYAYTLYYLGRKPETEYLRARASAIAGVVQ